MIYHLNPLRLLVKNQNDPPGDPPYELYVGSPKKITSYLYKKHEGKVYLNILFNDKFFELYEPDIEELFSICPHLIRKKPWQGFKYLWSKLFTSRYSGQSTE